MIQGYSTKDTEIEFTGEISEVARMKIKRFSVKNKKEALSASRIQPEFVLPAALNASR